MINTCPKCSAKMIETTGPCVRGLRFYHHPPQYEIIMWCGCGYSEHVGWKKAYTTEYVRMEEWKRLNSNEQLVNC